MIRRPALRWARQEAEGPTLDPLLDATRIIVLAQRLAREQVHGADVAAPGGDQAPQAR